jgi:ubiquitin-activating enzyme E1
MNPRMKVVALLERMSPHTETTFNDTFFGELSLVANALDNMEARLYIDSRCVSNGRALVDGGTLGPKGNV